MSTADARLAIDKLEAVAADLSDDAVLLTVTGLLPASLPMQDLLVGLMAKSLLVLSLFVAVALVLVARSISGGLILMIRNLMAVVAVLGLMGFLAIPIDFTTVSVASLVLGVAVDDTLQLTWAGRRDEGHHRFSPGRAVRRTATPVLLGSFAMIAGALTLAFSPFPPTQRLGGLLGVGLAVALAADLTLTPLLLAARKTRRSVGQGV